MIWTVCQISILRLWNNKQELLLALVVPVLFFSVFALIFSRGIGESLSQVRVVFIDDDRTPESRAVLQAAREHPEIIPVTGVGRTSPEWPIERLSKLLISRRDVEVVVHIPKGFTSQDPDNPTLSIALHNEGINPIGHRVVQASLAEAIALQFSAASVAAMRETRPKIHFASTADSLSDRPSNADALGPKASVEVRREPQVFESVSVFASNKHQPKIAMYAAGIAVMFLLFSANGAGVGLLEERETGTLKRLLNSRLKLGQLLLGKWLYMTGLGCVQLLVMFAWGQVVFRIDLLGHFIGFAAMTLATSAACASFALFLTTLCRTRQQLHGVSIVIVLTMSAIGGSMVPRYIMSDTMRSLGKFTFNGWALSGFQKIFWYDLSLSAVRVEICVLLGITLLLGLTSRALAQRWSCG